MSVGVQARTTEDPEGANGWRRVLLLLAGLTLSSSLAVFLTGAMAISMERDLGLDISQLGISLSTYFLTVGFGSAPLGRFAAWIGRRQALQISAVLSALSLAGIALLVYTWVGLLIALVLSGLAHALGQPAANWLMSDRMPKRLEAFSFAVKQSALPATALIGGLAVPIIALTIGWRWAFGLLALLPLTLLLGIQWLAIENRHSTTPVGHPRILKRSLILVSFTGLFGAASGASLAGFLVTSAVAKGISEGTAGRLLAAGSAAAIVGRLLAGWLASKRGTDGRAALILMLLLGTVGCVLLTSDNRVVLTIGVLLGFGTGWGWPGLYVYTVVRTHRAIPAQASGLAQSTAAIGASIGPVLFATIVNASSFTLGWLTVVVWLTIAAAFTASSRSPAQTEFG